MANIKQMAKDYESPETKNIAELDKVSTDLEVKVRVVNEGTPEEFSVNETVVDDETYRVPNSVLKQLKVILEDNPKLAFFKVKKTGEGMKTTYQVIPL